MWWCCGKTNPDALGCKFSAHIAKNDDEDDELDDQNSSMRNLRCTSCRGLGHSHDKCEKDPNLRTKFAISEEATRVAQLKADKALFADTKVATT